MSWVGEQMFDRIAKDQRRVERNQKILGDSVTGKKSEYYFDESSNTMNIIEIKRICIYLDQRVPDSIIEFKNINDQIDSIIRMSGIVKRRVVLNDSWWKDGDGPLLVVIKGTENVQALLPGRWGGYYYIDYETGRRKKVNARNKDQFESEAYCFYKTLPQKSLTGKEYIQFLLHEIRKGDLFLVTEATVLMSLLGILIPLVTKVSFSELIPSGEGMLLIPLGIMMISTAFATWMMNTVKMGMTDRIINRLEVVADNAVYSRVLNLPTYFFNDKSSGGLAQCVRALNMLPSMIGNISCGFFLPLVSSIIYIIQIIFIAPDLALPAFLTYFGVVILIVICVIQDIEIIQNQLRGTQENNGTVFDLISGIQKIKISGSEKRAFAKWMENYTDKARATFIVKFPASFKTPLITTLQLLGTMLVYIIAFKNQQTSIAQFAAFSSAFSLTMSSLTGIIPSSSYIAYIRPTLKIGGPILKEIPENSEGKKSVSPLSGMIELDNVVFRYAPDLPPVLNNINLSIMPGEYVAIVGKTGCGKSTLMKLLLGFESPESGVVLYDGYNLENIEKSSFRKNVGTVLQNGRLFPGDIFSNITISAPWLGMDEAWDAVEKVGMADDIRRMPMGMNTFISEGGGGISGGQRQRLVIARAIAPKPNILLFDEATSALDNITQKVVTDSLNALNCTRIVIAHRLSTIQECDRIIVLNQGSIAEEGSYDELIAKNGFFAELVSRQQID